MRLLKLAISLLYFAVRHGIRVLTLPWARGKVSPPTFLTYHAVGPGDVERFDRQMRELARRSTPVFAGHGANGSGWHCVAVTFDDGFQCVLEHALPVMRAHGVPATIFVPTGFLGKLPAWLRDDPQNATLPVADAVALAALDPANCQVGSHSVNHPDLAEASPEVLESELRDSRKVLERIMGKPVTLLSLPFGSCSPAVLAAAQKCGYSRVFLNVPVRKAAPDILAGRVNTSPDDWALEFRLKMLGGYQWLAVAIPVKRAVMRMFRREHRASPASQIARAK